MWIVPIKPALSRLSEARQKKGISGWQQNYGGSTRGFSHHIWHKRKCYISRRGLWWGCGKSCQDWDILLKVPLIFSLEIKVIQTYKGQLYRRDFAIFFYSVFFINSSCRLYGSISILRFKPCIQSLDLRYHRNHAQPALSTARPWSRVNSLLWHGMQSHSCWQKLAFKTASRAKN